MRKVIVMPSPSNLFSSRPSAPKRNHIGMTTSDFRRFLTNLQFQPPAHRTFLRNLLRRALAARGRDRFLVTILVNPTP
jgi:hypothetical protein